MVGSSMRMISVELTTTLSTLRKLVTDAYAELDEHFEGGDVIQISLVCDNDFIVRDMETEVEKTILADVEKIYPSEGLMDTLSVKLAPSYDASPGTLILEIYK